MKIGIMQPYFFPYIGYWQLINAVDKFVIYDDVNFIMRGYINRNAILINGQAYKFSIPLEKPSQNKLINETKLNFSDSAKNDFLKTTELAYKKAPCYKEVYPVLNKIIYNKETDLTTFIKFAIKTVNQYLGINTEILLSSDIEKDNSLKGQNKIIEICKLLNASQYINPIGGVDLYDKAKFQNENIKLNFLQTKYIIYEQFNNDFVENLSIIDVMMFNTREQIQNMLVKYDLV